MPRFPEFGDGTRRRRPIKRKKNEGVAPPNDRIRQIVKAARKKHKKAVPAELKAFLAHDGHDIDLNVIIGVLNGK